MKKYRVTRQVIYVQSIEVEAHDEQEAMDSLPSGDGWGEEVFQDVDYYEIEEIKE